VQSGGESELNSPPQAQTDPRATAIADYLATLPIARPNGTFPGGLVFSVTPAHLVGILLPPVDRAYDEFAAWLQRALGEPSEWEMTLQEEMPSADGQNIEAVHVVRERSDHLA
jgi:hypothetical protein